MNEMKELNVVCMYVLWFRPGVNNCLTAGRWYPNAEPRSSAFHGGTTDAPPPQLDACPGAGFHYIHTYIHIRMAYHLKIVNTYQNGIPP